MKIPENVKTEYDKWNDFLQNKVEFRLKDSEKHTKEHCSRVLLYSLLIARKMELTEEETESLCMAAVFHDSRRQDDWYDVGHGQRAADYYRQYCGESELSYNDYVYDIMYYHDRDDETGIRAMEGKEGDAERKILLYQIFKDADALDRFRLGPDGLDVRYLRTDAAKELYEYAKMVWYQYFAKEEGGITNAS